MRKREKKSGQREIETPAYSLNDDRRVRVLSPGALVVKRFLRNRLAVLGIVMLLSMFLFSFVGGLLSPYRQDQQFYRYENQQKEFAGVVCNDAFRYLAADGQKFTSTQQAKFQLAVQRGEDFFTVQDQTYGLRQEGEDFYSIRSPGGQIIAMAFKDIVSEEEVPLSFSVRFAALKAYTGGESRFTAEGRTYTLDEEGNLWQESADGRDEAAAAGFISRFVVSPSEKGVQISRDFREQLEEAVKIGQQEMEYTGEDGETMNYRLSYDPSSMTWSVKQEKETYVYDSYAPPSRAHWLGTDTNGMDMLTRLMYGGRVSLIIGFIVVFIETVIGVILGGISGYFGKWIDNLIMRIVDVFYCIPSMPLIIILGAAMDAMRVEPMTRMVYLMLILGFLGWPGIARMVRGQILSLREQEFMTAAEACGIGIGRRIFRHLIPNVIPQLIVLCTMSLGSTIITEATLSFLGIGVKFPFASWGNIITDVNEAYVMTHYWFVWIPAGICLLIAVLGFNFAGDGLRDAFDPKMKR